MRLCIVRRFIDYKFIKIDTSNGLQILVNIITVLINNNTIKIEM